MSGELHSLHKFVERAELAEVPLPTVPIVEIAGSGRVLIENHMGVKAYNRENILVNVAYGAVCVQGSGLELLRMSRDQLIIRGRIDGVTLLRRD